MSIIVPLNTPGNWEKGWGPWDTIHEAETANYNAGGGPSATATKGGTNSFLIKRGIFRADLSSVPPAATIYSAKLYMEYASGANNSGSTIYAALVDGTGVARNDSGYYEMLASATPLGVLLIEHSVFLPAFVGIPKEIYFNSPGLALLQAAIGGSVDIGLRMDKDVSDTEPPSVQQNYFNFSMSEEWDFWIELNYGIGGYLWVEGTKLTYLDAYRNKRAKEGVLV